MPHTGALPERALLPHITVNVGAGAGADGASTLVSFLNLLTDMLHGLQAFSGPTGLSKVLEGSSYPQSFLDPAKDGVT